MSSLMTLFGGLTLALSNLFGTPILAADGFVPDPDDITVNESVRDGVSNISSGTIEFLFETLPGPALVVTVLLVVAVLVTFMTGKLDATKRVGIAAALSMVATFALWNPNVTLPIIDSALGIVT